MTVLLVIFSVTSIILFLTSFSKVSLLPYYSAFTSLNNLPLKKSFNDISKASHICNKVEILGSCVSSFIKDNKVVWGKPDKVDTLLIVIFISFNY